MKRINAELIDARSRELESLVVNARFIESLSNQGTTPEELTKKAKEKLGLSEEDSIIINSMEKLEGFFSLRKIFRSTVNLVEDGKASGLLEQSEIEVLENLHKRLATELTTKLDVEVEDLYDEE